MTFSDALTFVWPICFLLVALVILRRVGSDIQPIAKAVAGSVAKNAAQYSLMYAMAFIYASAASLQALGEVATQFEWVYVAAFSKVVQPGVVAVIAYVTKPPSFTQAAPDAPSVTVVPISVSVPPANSNP